MSFSGIGELSQKGKGSMTFSIYDKRQSLLNRNNELARNVASLQLANSLLKAELRNSEARSLVLPLILKADLVPNKIDCESQTDVSYLPVINDHDFRYDSSSISDDSIQLLNHNDSVHDLQLVSGLHISGLSESQKQSSLETWKLPRTTMRNTKNLLNKIRSPRRVRDVLSYKEPSLRVKVRRGFKFFNHTN